MILPRPRLAGLLTTLVASAVLLTACPQANGYQAELAFRQLRFDQMLGLQPIPGDPGHGLLLTKDGVIRRVDLSGSGAAPSIFLDIRDRMIANPAPEEGLLGLAFAPDFASSGRLYIYYTRGDPRRSTVSRFVGSGDHADPASEKVLLLIPEPYDNHNGGALAFGPDGMLYVGVGDGGSGGDPAGFAQRHDTLHGKILRIDVSGAGYAIPGDNPFVGQGGREEIYALGFRNPWRISFDAATGDLWVADVGQDAWEEVDRVFAGANYGWNRTEGNHCYAADACDTYGVTFPVAEYGHDYGCAIIGGFVYHGAALPELDDWYLYGDYCTGRIWGVDAHAGGGAAFPLADTGLSISSFAQDASGEVYVVTFNNQIARLTRK